MLGKLTANSAVLLALTAFTAAVAVYYNNPLLVYTAVFLIVANIVLFIWANNSVRGLKVRRILPAAGIAGQPLQIGIELVNTRSTARFGTVGFDLHGAVTPGTDYSPVAFQVAHPGRPALASYRIVPPRRGIFRLGPLFIYGGDPFGMYKCWHKVDSRSDLLVLPCPVRFRGIHPSSVSEMVREESGSQARSGDSTEFLGVREYTHGEPLKRIHWPTSVRHGKLYSRQYELNVASSLSLLIIGDERMLAGSGADNPFEYSITLAASLSAASSIERYYICWLVLNAAGFESCRGTGPRFNSQSALKLARLGPPGRLDWNAHGSRILSALPADSALLVCVAGDLPPWVERLNRLAVRYRGLTVIHFNAESFDHAAPMPYPKLKREAGMAFTVVEAGYHTPLDRLLRAALAQIAIEQAAGQQRRLGAKVGA